MPWTEPLANSNELRRCIRDLVALSALPGGWQNYDMRQIGGSIVAALISILDADFVFIALPGEGNQLISELARNKLTPESLPAKELAGEKIESVLTKAPGNGAALGGIKVATKSGWFAARPSGTENVYKIYAESFKDQAHLDAIVREAQEIVSAALK